MTEPTTDLTSELWGLQPIRDALGRIPGVSVLSISTTGRVVDVLNPAALHRTVAELIEVDVSEWWGPMPADDAEPQKVEWPDPRGDAVFTIELVPVCEREGTRLGTIALTRDITDRLRTAELARAALDAANDGIVIVDDSQRYVEANQAACRLLGYTRAEFLSKTIADVVSPATHRTWESLLADGGTTGHVDLVRADGAVVTAEFGSKAHVVPGRHLSILRDATERLRQEHLLREARALFEGAFDSAPVGMAMIDATPDRRGVFIRVNRAFAALVDSAPERLVGTDSLDLIHPEDRDEISARRGSGRDAALFSTPRVRRGDGSYACTETTTTHVHDADGHVDYMLAVVVDTTERRLGEENLRASEERFRTMVEASGEGVCVFDDRDCVGFVNPRMVEMAGDRSGTPVGGPATRLVVDEDAAALTAALDACRAGRPARCELRLRRASREALPVILSASPLTSRDGRFGGTLAVVTDVSNLVAAERERAESNRRMHDQQRLEAISRLAGGIGHDFNNLLGVILNFTGFVDAELTARPDLQADLGHIRAAAERAAELTRQLLTYARQEVAAPAVFDLRELLDDAEALLRPALSSGVRLSVTLPDTPCTVLADRHQLEQVLLNLAINAREAMPTGGDLSLVLSTAAGTVDLRVRDTGTGMAEDVIAHAFDPFFTTRETPGGGLGLASVYGIIAESHGEVELVSGEGEGTTVGIRLPAVARQDGAEGSLTAISASELVLLVEDEPLVRRMAVRLLENAGFAVIACDDPAEALDQAELLDGTVRVLVTDLSLPGMTGEQLAREIRTRLPAVAVVFMSGYTGDELARNAVRSATSVFLGKPFSGKELVDAVQRSLAVAPGPAPFAAGS